jgi:hypothetical protein
MLKKFIYNLLLIIISILLSLYSLEIFLLTKSGYKFFNNYDYRTDIEVYNEDKKNFLRTDTLKYITKTENGILPLSGLSLKKIIVCNESGFWSKYFSDRYGFNNPDLAWNNKTVDFILVGDSFTEGACVNENDTISSNLRKISNMNVINIGRGGTAALSHLALLREYLPYGTKRIVWIYYENDIIDLEFEMQSELLVKYLKDKKFSQKLQEKQYLIDQIHLKEHNKLINALNKKDRASSILRIYGTFNTDKFSYLKLYTLRNFLRERYLENSKIEKKESEEILKFDKNFDNFKKIIYNANELALNNNINFYFVYLSSRPKYAAKYDGENYKKVINLIEEYNIPVIDMHKFFKEHNDPLSMFPFRRQLDYNEIGYRFVANQIYNFITEHEKL